MFKNDKRLGASCEKSGTFFAVEHGGAMNIFAQQSTDGGSDTFGKLLVGLALGNMCVTFY